MKNRLSPEERFWSPASGACPPLPRREGTAKRILWGITGRLSAREGAELARRLTARGFSVQALMAVGAERSITPLALQTLTNCAVYADTPEPSEHEDADLALIAPATANVIGKLAAGIADTLLSAAVVAIRGKPILLCPAMNPAVYENPAVQDNIERLKRYGSTASWSRKTGCPLVAARGKARLRTRRSSSKPSSGSWAHESGGRRRTALRLFRLGGDRPSRPRPRA
jgi:phosphopantothenoylcysteine decarboxylase/phosphopantothenoylcysteine decarboxylase/phosphopantothenate--cysteine ligase